MTDLRALLAPIRERLAAATPGPWFQGRASDRYENTREVYSEREVSATSEDVATFIHHPEDAALIANAPTDLARLLAAIEAVAALHKPVSSGITGVPHSLADYDVCPKCFNDDGWPVAYPCPTVAAVEAALKGEE